MVTNEPVCVTGVSGFIAAHVVRELLEGGYRVRGTVRSTKNLDKYSYLTSLPGAEERLELVEAELLNEGSYDSAVMGCEYVIHMASPYIIDVKDPQKDLVDPALKGTLNVMRACEKADGVKRVVLTSSMAAISDEPENNKVFSEEDWNEKSSLDRNPYYYSKTLAERAGWDYLEEKKPHFDLVVINPFLVVGQSLGPSLNSTVQIFRDLMSGVYPAIMSISWGMVNVRDVAKAHVAAMEKKEAKGRYLVANDSITMGEVIDLLQEAGYNGYKIPSLKMTGSIGSFLMKMASYTQPKGTGDFMRTHIGKVMRFDNSKTKRELGIEFIPVKQSILDSVKDLIKWGHLEEAGG